MSDYDWSGTQTFRLKVTTHNNKEAISSEITINIPSSTFDISNSTLIYQNGTKVFIKTGATYAYIYSSNGVLFHEYDLQHDQSIELSSLPKGYYIIRTNKNEQLTIIR